MKKLILLSLLFCSSFSSAQISTELPVIDFKEAKNMSEEAKVFLQRLVRYTCDGALAHARSKNFVPKVYDFSIFRGKNIEYSFRLQFDRSENHAEISIYENQNEIRAYIPKDTRDGLCLLGKFYLRDIESYETHLEF